MVIRRIRLWGIHLWNSLRVIFSMIIYWDTNMENFRFACQISTELFHQNLLLIYLIITTTLPWLKHIRLSEDFNQKGIESGLQAGDLQMVSYIMSNDLFNIIYQGGNLENLLSQTTRGIRFTQDIKEKWSMCCFLAGEICIQNILGHTKNKFDFDLNDLKENNFLQLCEQNYSFAAICLYYIFKAQILYLYNSPVEPEYFKKSQEMLAFIQEQYLLLNTISIILLH